MGEPDGNPYVPFRITYITDPVDPYILRNPNIVPCNKAVDVSFCRPLDDDY